MEGFENISLKLEQVDGSMAPDPIISDTKKDYCLVVWNLHGDSMCCEHGNLCQHKLSHDSVFYSTKKEWSFNRDFNHFNAINEDNLLKSKPSGCYLPNACNILSSLCSIRWKANCHFAKT